MTKKRIIVFLLSIALIITGASLVHIIGSGMNEDKKASENASRTPQAVIFATSDYQEEEGFPPPRETLAGNLKRLKTEGKTPDSIILCGDYSNDGNYHDYQLSSEDAIQEIKATTKKIFPEVSSERMMFVQGNHDALSESITTSGLHEFDDYLVYVLNTQNDFPWKQGKEAGSLQKVKDSSKAMKKTFDKLIEDGETRPVIIAGHLPLHYTARTSSLHTTGDNLYSSLIFDVVNNAGKDLNIIYLYGHNHSKGWDAYMGGSSVYKPVGETLLIPDFKETDINTDKFSARKTTFTYMNAGYSGYYMNCSDKELLNGTADQYDTTDKALTGTLIEIYKDKLVVNRYSGDGVHQLGSKGSANPYLNDRGLIPEKYYAKRIDCPQSIKRK